MRISGLLLWAVVVAILSTATTAAQDHIPVPGEKSDYAWYLEMVRRNSAAPSGAPRPEPRVIKKGPLAPSVNDREAYAQFLSQPDTGLIKLLPQSFDGGKETVTKHVKVRGGGRFYSFSYLSHDYSADIELGTDIVCKGRGNGTMDCQYPRKLAAGGYGMLTNLGNLPLTKFDSNDSRVKFMQAYIPPRGRPQARCAALEFRKGVTVNGQLFANRLPLEVGSTYLLRAFDYLQSDVLVVFEVLRQDADGGVTLAWKLLNRFTPLKLENVVYANNPTDKCPTK
jgi:hypothetical protein